MPKPARNIRCLDDDLPAFLVATCFGGRALTRMGFVVECLFGPRSALGNVIVRSCPLIDGIAVSGEVESGEETLEDHQRWRTLKAYTNVPAIPYTEDAWTPPALSCLEVGRRRLICDPDLYHLFIRVREQILHEWINLNATCPEYACLRRLVVCLPTLHDSLQCDGMASGLGLDPQKSRIIVWELGSSLLVLFACGALSNLPR